MDKSTIVKAAVVAGLTIVAFALWDFVLRDALFPTKAGQ